MIYRLLLSAATLAGFLLHAAPAQQPAADLPIGVKAVWDLSKAVHESTPTRERICINGLWQWQPASAQADRPPTGDWGYFKVPGCWPGISDYLQKDSQTLFAHPSWKGTNLAGISGAWYRREISVPASWTGRRITLETEYLNSFATVFIDDKKAGEIRFPGGELDLTTTCPPGSKHVLSMLVIAMPLKGVMMSYTDSANAREVKGKVERRGLCGDVFLASAPSVARLAEVSVATSVRKGELTSTVILDGLDIKASYALRVRVLKEGKSVKEFTGQPFRASDLKDNRYLLTEKWKPETLWDIHTPQNTFDLEASLLDAAGHTVDTATPCRFGFREFWIDKRDFFLNGTRIHLSAVPIDNAEVSAAMASYDAARETLARLKTIGINYVYTHNYGCEPGSHLSFTELLKAADDVGMLVGFSQPHFSHYDWKAPDADQNNGYGKHAEYYVRMSANHPSVVMYHMSHNATGYEEDMNPDMIDGIHEGRDQWSSKNVQLAMRAQAIVEHLDPSRIVYHHASGNLGVMHDSNFYVNFAPPQELDDWFEHWATTGVKPMFTCEYAVPMSWDWTMYRGWYKGQREFGSATVPWEFCLPEWNSQFFGQKAYRGSEPEKANLRYEAKQMRAGKLWHRWDFPNPPSSPRLEEMQPVLALYLTENWRAFRTHGVSAVSPWVFTEYWNLREGVKRDRRELSVNWDNLQRPGFSGDYVEPNERMDLSFERADWIPTVAGEAILRNNRPLLAYIAGKEGNDAGTFTVKDHNYLPGARFDKQIVAINDSREPVKCDAEWMLHLPAAISGKAQVTIAPGDQARIPLHFDLPAALPAGAYELQLTAKFSTGETQEDRFTIDVLNPAFPVLPAKIAIFDPEGETQTLLASSGVKTDPVEATADLSRYEILVVGRRALSTTGPAPDISRVRSGLKVIIFEQTAQALEKRFGFRTAEYGLRQVFPCCPFRTEEKVNAMGPKTIVSYNPVLAFLSEGNLRDWTGEATLVNPQLKYELRPRYGPTIEWCGIPVTHVWRCGNRGNVASVLIEKPARGNFMPIVEGGFGLQYSPLLEYREGTGMVVFCQMDVTGRVRSTTQKEGAPKPEPESDPAALFLVRNLLNYAAEWKPRASSSVLYAGEPAGNAYLADLGITVSPLAGSISPAQLLVAGPGSGKELAAHATELGSWLKAGGHFLGLALDQEDLDALPFKVTVKKSEYINAAFDSFPAHSLLAGVAPAGLYNRDPRQIPLLTSGVQAYGGVLGQMDHFDVLLCQIAPWQFDGDQLNLRRTHRTLSVLTTRLLTNMGAVSSTPLLDRFHTPVDPAKPGKRWEQGFYLDQPVEWDYPYRFFRW